MIPKLLCGNTLLSASVTTSRSVYGLSTRYFTQDLAPSLVKLHSELKPDELLTDNTPDYVRLVLRSSVYDVIKESPISHGVGLSSRLNTNV